MSVLMPKIVVERSRGKDSPRPFVFLALLLIALALVSAAGCRCAFPAGEYWPHETAAPESDKAAGLLEAAEARWSDPALADSARRMSARVGLELYEELAWVVVHNYADPVSYDDLLLGGLESLKVALGADAFCENFPAARDGQRVAQFLAALEEIEDEVVAGRTRWSGAARRRVQQVLDVNDELLHLPPGAIIAEFVFGASNRLDGFSMYLTPQMLASLRERMQGKYVGVGLIVASEDGDIVVESIVADSPAEKSEIKVGDRIIAVDGKAVAERSLVEVLGWIRGPKGTKVTLTISRPGEALERKVILTRSEVTVLSVSDVRMLDAEKGIGYIELSAFQEDTPREMAAAIRELKAQNLAALVVDLRGNPGGLLTSAVAVCSQFLSRGRVVSTEGRGWLGRRKYDISLWNTRAWDGPLVVLIDRSTASGAEIMAAALKAHGRAVLVGQRTYGKGASQLVWPLEWGQSAIDLTTSRMKDPAGNTWHKTGVVPDIVIADDEQLPEEKAPAEPERDLAIEKAVDVLRCRLQDTNTK